MQQNTCQYTTSMMGSNVLGYSKIASNSPLVKRPFKPMALFRWLSQALTHSTIT
ncbi:hypothetical protein DAPPUDRAFT_258975 [Daphnia pulex]|uniref:Uncharacterized protein n=1 Tax=Daphnia pulex TaxID=6669 RepID=E9HGC5_DAPPU|nr:hypothetical protein DAPPUDRAFT_258975 [Daphnia pulex]|eukprot:EFX69201.1 hypothetical protein DAPPUDRAFT_258975 [Daphnia pulex]